MFLFQIKSENTSSDDFSVILLPCFQLKVKLLNQNFQMKHVCNSCRNLNYFSEIFRLFLVIQSIVHRVAVGQWSVVCGAVAGYSEPGVNDDANTVRKRADCYYCWKTLLTHPFDCSLWMIPSSQWGKILFKQAFTVSSTCVFTDFLSDD